MAFFKSQAELEKIERDSITPYLMPGELVEHEQFNGAYVILTDKRLIFKAHRWRGLGEKTLEEIFAVPYSKITGLAFTKEIGGFFSFPTLSIMISGEDIKMKVADKEKMYILHRLISAKIVN